MRSVRIGVLGGTFDPPHYGHLALAENGRVQLGLDEVLFVPAGQPPHKPGRPITPARQRAAMVLAAIGEHPAFRLSHVDLARPGPHYTADTLAMLQEEYPTAELFFLLGGDSLAQFLTWYAPERIVHLATLAVMGRSGYEPDRSALEAAIPGMRQRVVRLDVPYLGLSSSDLRRRVGAGLPLRYLVPPEVERYIRAHRLYLSEAEGGIQ